MRSPSKENQAPLFSTMPHSTPRSSRSPSTEMPAVVEDVELRLPEGRRHLVLHHLDARAVADHLLAVLERRDAPHVEPHRGVELERVAAGGGLGVAEHHADLHADLVDEDHRGVRLRDGARELAQRLAHQPRLQAHVLVAHLALDLGARHQRRHRVDHDEVDRARAQQHVDDLERLLAGVGLRDEQVVDLHAEPARVADVERVLGVDEGRHAAAALHLRDRVQRERGLAARLRAEDLDDAPARIAADAEREIEARRAASRSVSTSRSTPSSLMVRMAPLPNCFSMVETASAIALSRSDSTALSVAAGLAAGCHVSLPPRSWFQG